MGGKSTVLIVDDAPDNLMLLNGLLRDDYSVKATNNGLPALRIASDAPQPDLILLDILDINDHLVMVSGSELSAYLIGLLKTFADNGKCRSQMVKVWEGATK